MRINQANKYSAGNGMGKSLLRGFLLSVGVFSVATAAAAFLIGQNSVPLDSAAVLGKLIFAASALTGCLIASKTARSGKLLAAFLNAAGFFVAVFAVLRLLRGERGHMPTSLLLIAFGAALIGGLLGAKKKRIGYV